jgi:hypothetical protein
MPNCRGIGSCWSNLVEKSLRNRKIISHFWTMNRSWAGHSRDEDEDEGRGGNCSSASGSRSSGGACGMPPPTFKSVLNLAANFERIETIRSRSSFPSAMRPTVHARMSPRPPRPRPRPRRSKALAPGGQGTLRQDSQIGHGLFERAALAFLVFDRREGGDVRGFPRRRDEWWALRLAGRLGPFRFSRRVRAVVHHGNPLVPL